MPNWVFNSLVVSGDKSDLEAMVAQLNQPVTKHYPKMEFDQEQQKWIDTPDVQQYDNPVFSFWNVSSPTDLEAYYGEEVFKKTDLSKGKTINEAFDSNDFLAEFHRAMNFDNDWYHWNVRNWGTKWDAKESFYNQEDKILEFQTAWSCPETVLMKMFERFPDLHFEGTFADEDFGCNAGYIGSEDGFYPLDSQSEEAYEVAATLWGYEGYYDDEKGKWIFEGEEDEEDEEDDE